MLLLLYIYWLLVVSSICLSCPNGWRLYIFYGRAYVMQLRERDREQESCEHYLFCCVCGWCTYLCLSELVKMHTIYILHVHAHCLFVVLNILNIYLNYSLNNRTNSPFICMHWHWQSRAYTRTNTHRAI